MAKTWLPPFGGSAQACDRAQEVPHQVQSLREDIAAERAWLRVLLARWQATDGWVMRPHWRAEARDCIRAIRAAESNLRTWGVDA